MHSTWIREPVADIRGRSVQSQSLSRGRVLAWTFVMRITTVGEILCQFGRGKIKYPMERMARKASGGSNFLMDQKMERVR